MKSRPHVVSLIKESNHLGSGVVTTADYWEFLLKGPAPCHKSPALSMILLHYLKYTNIPKHHVELSTEEKHTNSFLKEVKFR